VLGAAALGPDQLDTELAWLDAHLGGRPYGVDVLVPEPSAAGRSPGDLARRAAPCPGCPGHLRHRRGPRRWPGPQHMVSYRNNHVAGFFHVTTGPAWRLGRRPCRRRRGGGCLPTAAAGTARRLAPPAWPWLPPMAPGCCGADSPAEGSA
jgi:hypothetical protein